MMRSAFLGLLFFTCLVAHKCAAGDEAEQRAMKMLGERFLHALKDDNIAAYAQCWVPAEHIYGPGGLAVDNSTTPEEVRKKTRSLIETCGKRGRYAVGSGNSVPSYVPVENYLAMIDEAVE